MRLLSRYLLRECLIALGFCFSAFLILWITLDLFSELHGMQENRMGVWKIVEYYVFKIPAPDFLPVALPVALLLALLYALTNHARHNEITAIRAAGVSLFRLSLPYFGVGLTCAAALYVSNEFVAPASTEIAEQIMSGGSGRAGPKSTAHIVKNLAFHNGRANRYWQIGSYDSSTATMVQPQVDERLPDGSRRSLFAERAVFTNHLWIFFQVSGYKQASATNSTLVPLPKQATLSMPDLTETPDQIASEINILDSFNHPTRTHRADVPVSEIINYLRLDPNPEPLLRSWLYTKLYGRFAGPCTCVVVVLLAVPFGARAGRKNVFVGVAASIVIFFVYYLMQQLGFAFGEAGRIPAWLGAWLPNLLFGSTGLWMLTRVR